MLYTLSLKDIFILSIFLSLPLLACDLGHLANLYDSDDDLFKPKPYWPSQKKRKLDLKASTDFLNNSEEEEDNILTPSSDFSFASIPTYGDPNNFGFGDILEDQLLDCTITKAPESTAPSPKNQASNARFNPQNLWLGKNGKVKSRQWLTSSGVHHPNYLRIKFWSGSKNKARLYLTADQRFVIKERNERARYLDNGDDASAAHGLLKVNVNELSIQMSLTIGITGSDKTPCHSRIFVVTDKIYDNLDFLVTITFSNLANVAYKSVVYLQYEFLYQPIGQVPLVVSGGYTAPFIIRNPRIPAISDTATNKLSSIDFFAKLLHQAQDNRLISFINATGAKLPTTESVNIPQEYLSYLGSTYDAIRGKNQRASPLRKRRTQSQPKYRRNVLKSPN